MQRLEVSGAVRHIYGSLGVKSRLSPWYAVCEKGPSSFPLIRFLCPLDGPSVFLEVQSDFACGGQRCV